MALEQFSLYSLVALKIYKFVRRGNGWCFAVCIKLIGFRSGSHEPFVFSTVLDGCHF